MENIDISYLIKILGGLTVIVSSSISFIAYLIHNRLIDKWRKSDQSEIAKLQGLIDRNNSIITTLTTKGRNETLDQKEFEAIEKTWEFVIKVKRSVPASIYSAYTLLSEEEFTIENINKFSETELSTLTKMDILKNNVSISEIEKYRPLLSNNLWLLVFAFQASIGRTKYLLIDGYHKGKPIHWKNDEYHQSILKSVLSETELKYLAGTKLQSYEALIKIFEQRILDEIKKINSGELKTEESFKIAKKIIELVKKEDQD